MKQNIYFNGKQWHCLSIFYNRKGWAKLLTFVQKFYLRNIKNNSISEIWNSPRALYLANIPQSNIREDNVCSDCTLYSKCSAYPNKCYADVLKAYGDDNWDFPDPRCNKAPQFINSMN
ncbi:MAG: SPASM domain-containing protein [Prevotella sp.]